VILHSGPNIIGNLLYYLLYFSCRIYDDVDRDGSRCPRDIYRSQVASSLVTDQPCALLLSFPSIRMMLTQKTCSSFRVLAPCARRIRLSLNELSCTICATISTVFVGFESAHSFRWPLCGATASKLSNPEVLEELHSPDCKAVMVKERCPVSAGMKLSDRLLLRRRPLERRPARFLDIFIV
jgi:hypothetical protein